jgi:hypothetical protein
VHPCLPARCSLIDCRGVGAAKAKKRRGSLSQYRHAKLIHQQNSRAGRGTLRLDLSET